MYLEQVEVSNFRGIRHLKIDFQEDSTALIGENAWGKTSLLRLLWTILGQGENLCNFLLDDVYVPVAINGENIDPRDELIVNENLGKIPNLALDANKNSSISTCENKSFVQDTSFIDEEDKIFLAQDVFCARADFIEVNLFFSESTISQNFDDEPTLRKYWIYGDDGIYRLHWHIVARKEGTEFKTKHELLNAQGRSFDKTGGNVDKALMMIIRLNPVLRIRDSRMLSCTGANNCEEKKDSTEESFSELIGKLATDMALSASEVRKAMVTVNALLSKYLSCYDHPKLINYSQEYRRNAGDIINRPISIETLSTINNTFQKPGINKVKFLLSLLAGAVLTSRQGLEISKRARPIVIFEDIEARFHPSLLLSFWSLIEALDFQKIVTTNSGDLLSAMPLYSLRRLHKRRYDTRCYKIQKRSFNDEEVRRIAFHVRINRPMSLFARTWILVEGETEVWVLSTIASLLGYSLPCDGIRIIEFAQCGLSPLIKLAKYLGINFHVLTDGDDAGQKYAQSVRSRLDPKEDCNKHLTIMPHVDIEHYIYANGYQDVFKLAAGMSLGPLKKGINSDKVIDIALKRKSKPGMALILVEAMQKRGVNGIPPLFIQMIEQVRALGRDEALI